MVANIAPGWGSPSLHVDVNRAEGHSCRVLAAVAVWAQGRWEEGLGPLGSSSRLVLMFLERDTHARWSLLPHRLNDFGSDGIDVDHR